MNEGADLVRKENGKLPLQGKAPTFPLERKETLSLKLQRKKETDPLQWRGGEGRSEDDYHPIPGNRREGFLPPEN